MPRVIAYSWEADVHCTACSKIRFPADQGKTDENGVPYEAVDREGNTIYPLFDHHEVLEDIFCGTCGDEIATAPDD